jgi:molybdopterin synthase catalytic subunit
VGDLAVNEQIVLVITTSKHRKNAFDACEFIMDYLKTQAPFWKKKSRTRPTKDTTAPILPSLV